MGAETTRRLPFNPGFVWTYICKLQRYPDWIFLTRRITRSSGPLEVGATYEESGPLGRSTWQVTAWDFGRQQIHEGRMIGLRLRVMLILTPEGADTRMTHRIDAAPIIGLLGWPLLRLMTAVLVTLLKRQLKLQHAGLQGALVT